MNMKSFYQEHAESADFCQGAHDPGVRIRSLDQNTPDFDEFQNLISHFLSKVTSLAKFSQRFSQ